MTKILVVDDNPINSITLKNQLKHLGFDVDTATDGESALSQHENNSYTVILLDYYMPDMSGAELGSKIRALDETRGYEANLFSISADSQIKDINDFASLNIIEHLQKPITQQVLSRVLAPWQQKEIPPVTGNSTSRFHNINWNELNKWLPTDPKEAYAFLNEFSDTNAQGIAIMVNALETGDYIAVANEAHRLKAPPKAFGMNKLASMLEQIQNAASQHLNPDSLLTLIKELEKYHLETDADIKQKFSVP